MLIDMGLNARQQSKSDAEHGGPPVCPLSLISRCILLFRCRTARGQHHFQVRGGA